MQFCAWYISRGKEWKALRVIVVQMTEQQHDFAGTLAPCQFAAQRNDSRSCIEEDCSLARAYLYRGSISAILHRPRARRRITPTHTPEFNSQFVGHSTPPIPISLDRDSDQYLHALYVLLRSKPYNYINVHPVFFSRKVFAREVGNISHIDCAQFQTSCCSVSRHGENRKVRKFVLYLLFNQNPSFSYLHSRCR